MRPICALVFLASLSPVSAAEPTPVGPTPIRILANAPSNAEIVCALGVCDRLVGVSTFVTFPPELRSLPRIGGLQDPDLEAIVALHPDLLLQRGHNEHVIALCRKHGIRLYVDRTDSMSSLYTTISELGAIMAREAQAATLNEDIRVQLAKIAENAPEQPPRVLLALRSPDRLAPLTSVGEPSFLHEIIKLAGGRNVQAHSQVPYPTLDLEEIIAAQPDIILDVMPGRELSAADHQEIVVQWSRLRTVPAVRQGRIHVLTEDYALTPSPRVVLLAERLNKIFRGEANPGE